MKCAQILFIAVVTPCTLLQQLYAVTSGLLVSASTASTATWLRITYFAHHCKYRYAKGAIKHVWLIILENKSYDATFTGLNSNSYLWQTLPQQGALLTKYYGTGHSSMDNYLSMVSGQGPSEDVQDDCSTNDTLINTNSGIVAAGGSLKKNANYGQLVSKGGANAALGLNGCSYPTNVPTLFNQFNAAGVTWKDYGEELGGGQNYLQAPDTTFQSNPYRSGPRRLSLRRTWHAANNPSTNPLNLVAPTGDVSSYTSAQNLSVGGVNYIDQYVAKHNPVPWFESLTGQVSPAQKALNEPSNGGTNCDSDHTANLDNPNTGLVHDLMHNTVPNFGSITSQTTAAIHTARDLQGQ